MTRSSSTKNRQLPNTIIGLIIVICLTPFLLNLIGIDFASTSVALPAHDAIVIDDLFYRLSGAFTHTILEWSAFTVAIMTAILGFVHYKVAKDVTIPVICIALFCAGSMDAFHTLAADRLIDAVADNRNLIPFTWAISRTFNALIIIIGVSLFLFKPDLGKKAGLKFIALVSLGFIFLAFIIIQYCATSEILPQTMFPDSVITRPWDVAPLVLYIVAGLTILRRFNQQNPSVFTHSLLISMIPETVVELHMAFGSTALFDNDFNIAHFIKIFAYLIPLIGLMIEYIQTYSRLEQSNIALKSSESLFRTFINSAPVMMWMLDEKHKPITFNSAWLEFTGRDLEQEIENLWDGSEIHIDDRQQILDAYDTAFKQQDSFDHEYRLQCSYGVYRWVREIGVPNFDHTKQYRGFIGIAIDITDSKKSAEKIQNYTTELERSNADLEQFAYIASHDLQEPLRMVSSYTQLLARRYKDKLDNDANEFIDFAVDGTTRMQRLIQDLLSFSRVSKQSQKLDIIDSNTLLANVLRNLQISITENNAHITFSDSLPIIKVDPSQFEQLLQNIISNALKYHDPSRPCEIDIQCEFINNMWQFSVSDNGIGIEADYFERIFIIFKRLHGKEEYSGTGIGLAVCQRIVHAHGGDIWLTSKLGQGSTFYFTLPNIED